MRGRFHPIDGQLFLCGMYAWAGSRQQPGGFYRLRHTGRPVHVPIGLHAARDGINVTFSGPLDPASAATAGNYAVRIWSLRRTARYGSDHHDERSLKVTAAALSEDGRTVQLRVPDIQPTWCMKIEYRLQGAGGEPVVGAIHNTIHRLADQAKPD
jgi:hypothetical protein